MAAREPTGRYADRVLGFADALGKLFRRRVNLNTEESMRNPYFRSHFQATRQIVYEKPDQSERLRGGKFPPRLQPLRYAWVRQTHRV